MRHALHLWIILLCAGLSASSTKAEELLQVRNTRPLQAESVASAMEPWETPISGFFIRSHHGPPVIDENTFILKIDGLVEKPLSLNLAQLKKMETKTLHAVLECAGNGRGLQKPTAGGVQWQKFAIGNAEWTGISIAELLKMAGVKTEARFARLSGADQAPYPTTPKFTRSVPLDKLRLGDSILAWKMNREPMPLLHGGPLRVILPGWYAENWTKWVNQITLTADEDQGFYQKKAYRSTTGNRIEQLRVQSFIVSPVTGQTLGTGDLTIQGKAFSGAGNVSKVEISQDGGHSWVLAKLEPAHPDGGWQEFKLTVKDQREGSASFIARASDSTGAKQPMEAEWNPSGYLRNSSDAVTVAIAKNPLPPASFRAKCLACHTEEMTQSQRLTPKQWEATLKKMESFGAQLTADDRDSILGYVSRFSPELPPAETPMIDYARASLAQQLPPPPQGTPSRGQKIFQNKCVSCHGKEGEGLVGPRLIGRDIPPNEFWLTVLYGKRTMPSFAADLRRQQVADLQSYLRMAGGSGISK